MRRKWGWNGAGGGGKGDRVTSLTSDFVSIVPSQCARNPGSFVDPFLGNSYHL